MNRCIECEGVDKNILVKRCSNCIILKLNELIMKLNDKQILYNNFFNYNYYFGKELHLLYINEETDVSKEYVEKLRIQMLNTTNEDFTFTLKYLQNLTEGKGYNEVKNIYNYMEVIGELWEFSCK